MLLTRGRILLERWTAWSPAAMLAALAALTFWLDAQVQDTGGRGPRDGRHAPDLFLTNFQAVTFDRTGTIKQSLRAQRAEHHPHDQSVEFVAPSLVLTDPGRPTFSITAETGSLSGDRQTVIFRGKVRATRDPLPGAGEGGMLTLSTEFLRVVPERGLAETDQAVTIEESHGIIQGVGLSLDNRSRTMSIRSAVRGTLNPGSAR